MRRDPRNGRASRAFGDAAHPEQAVRDAELLTAYVDGVVELAPDERHRIEARLAGDPEVRAEQAAVRTLLDRLRALPPEGAEPDWGAMERSIRQAVGSERVRPWWRSRRWLVPAMSFATAAAVLLVLWARSPQVPEPAIRPADRTPADRTPADRTPADERPAEDLVALWLDGAEVDVDLSASEILRDDDPADEDPPQLGFEATAQGGLLPSADLAWVDKLDDEALDRAEHWLARKKG